MASSVPSPRGPGVPAGAAGPRCRPGLLRGQTGTGGAGQGHHGGAGSRTSEMGDLKKNKIKKCMWCSGQ